MEVRFTQLWVIANFANKHFTMDAFECCRIFNYWFLQEFSATPVGESNVKIGYHVAKLEQKMAPFFQTWCTTLRIRDSSDPRHFGTIETGPNCRTVLYHNITNLSSDMQIDRVHNGWCPLTVRWCGIARHVAAPQRNAVNHVNVALGLLQWIVYSCHNKPECMQDCSHKTQNVRDNT